MKRLFCLLLALAMLLSLAACAKEIEAPRQNFFESPEEITVDALLERTGTQTMLDYMGGFRADYRDDDAIYDGEFANTISMRFVYDGTNINANQLMDYDSGTYQHMFFTTDPTDPTLYIDSDMGVQSVEMDDSQLQSIMDRSLFGIQNYDCTIDECTDSGDSFALTLNCSLSGELSQKVEMNVDAKSGMVTDAVIYHYTDGTQTGLSRLTVTYDKNVEIDFSPRDKVKNQTDTAQETPVEDTQEESSADDTADPLTFDTTDLNGDPVSYSDFADAKLIMVNYWEPWCAPCVSEMPDLQKLYETYKDQGFVILGVFATEGGDEDAKAIVEDTGVTYPILHMDSNLSAYQTEYVPTTIFVGENGKVVSDEPYIGAHSYEDWETILKTYLAG